MIKILASKCKINEKSIFNLGQLCKSFDLIGCEIPQIRQFLIAMQFAKKIDTDEKTRFWDMFELNSFDEMIEIVK